MTVRALHMKDLPAKVGLSQSKIFAMMAVGEFPRSFHLTRQSSGWLESTVDEWILERASDITKKVESKP